jgi:hypothetical protein
MAYRTSQEPDRRPRATHWFADKTDNVRADPPRRAGRGRRPAAHASLPGCHQPDQTCVHLDATDGPEALTRAGVWNKPTPSASPPPPAAAAEHQDGHAGHAARHRVDDREQHSASQPSPRPPAGNSAGQPMQSSIRTAQDSRALAAPGEVGCKPETTLGLGLGQAAGHRPAEAVPSIGQPVLHSGHPSPPEADPWSARAPLAVGFVIAAA